MSGAPAGMMTPAMARSQMQAMKGMRPEDFEQMARMGDGPAAGAAPNSVLDAQRAAEIMKVWRVPRPHSMSIPSPEARAQMDRRLPRSLGCVGLGLLG